MSFIVNILCEMWVVCSWNLSMNLRFITLTRVHAFFTAVINQASYAHAPANRSSNLQPKASDMDLKQQRDNLRINVNVPERTRDNYKQTPRSCSVEGPRVIYSTTGQTRVKLQGNVRETFTTRRSVAWRLNDSRHQRLS